MKLKFNGQIRSRSLDTSPKNILKLPSINESFEYIRKFLEKSSSKGQKKSKKLKYCPLDEKGEIFSRRGSSIKTGIINSQRESSLEGLQSDVISEDLINTNNSVMNNRLDSDLDISLRQISATQVTNKFKSLLQQNKYIEEPIISNSLPQKSKVSAFNKQEQSEKVYKYNQFIEKFLLNYLENFIKKEEILVSLQRSKYYKLLNYIFLNQSQFLKNLARREKEDLDLFFFNILDLIQQADVKITLNMFEDLELFTKTLFLMGHYLREIDQKDNSVFIFQQCLIVSEYAQFYKLKCKVLQEISLLAKSFKLYEESLEIVQKSLQYAWHSNQRELEIKAYDMIGQCYFYKGQIAKALQYHNRWVLAETEPVNGFYRMGSAKMIGYYEQHQLHFIAKSFSQKLTSQLSLPITNYYTIPPIRIDKNKIIRYNNCQGILIINNMMNGFEFTNFKLEHLIMPKESKNQQKKLKYQYLKQNRILKQEVLPRRIREIQLRQAQKYNNKIFTHDIHDMSQFKVDLNDRMYQERMIQPPNELLQVEEKIRNRMGRHDDKFGDRKDVIYIRHILQSKKTIEEQEQICLKFYKQLQKIIDKIIAKAQTL